MTASRLLPLVLIVCFGCATTEKLSVVPLYAKKKFSGSDLNGQQVTLTPLISSRGVEKGVQFQPAELIGEIKKARPDIVLRRPDAFVERFRKRYGEDALDSLYHSFFSGEIVRLQTDERIWMEVQSGYLMVLKLTFGLKAKSLDDRTTRQMRIEGELWDCDSAEVVWRTVVDSGSGRRDETDKDVLRRAVVSLFNALPTAFHGYGKGAW